MLINLDENHRNELDMDIRLNVKESHGKKMIPSTIDYVCPRKIVLFILI